MLAEDATACGVGDDGVDVYVRVCEGVASSPLEPLAERDPL